MFPHTYVRKYSFPSGSEMSPRSNPEICRLKRKVSPSTFHVPSKSFSRMYAPTPSGLTTPPSSRAMAHGISIRRPLAAQLAGIHVPTSRPTSSLSLQRVPTRAFALSLSHTPSRIAAASGFFAAWYRHATMAMAAYSMMLRVNPLLSRQRCSLCVKLRSSFAFTGALYLYCCSNGSLGSSLALRSRGISPTDFRVRASSSCCKLMVSAARALGTTTFHDPRAIARAAAAPNTPLSSRAGLSTDNFA
mmetsp:Transcript_19490/g.42636  ORF Transcript_19490/g.42636 Transcript_19490/m.42636 type:complete len:246 (-) Transcript_19490:205-942(-)